MSHKLYSSVFKCGDLLDVDLDGMLDQWLAFDAMAIVVEMAYVMCSTISNWGNMCFPCSHRG